MRTTMHTDRNQHDRAAFPDLGQNTLRTTYHHGVDAFTWLSHQLPGSSEVTVAYYAQHVLCDGIRPEKIVATRREADSRGRELCGEARDDLTLAALSSNKSLAEVFGVYRQLQALLPTNNPLINTYLTHYLGFDRENPVSVAKIVRMFEATASLGLADELQRAQVTRISACNKASLDKVSDAYKRAFECCDGDHRAAFFVTYAAFNAGVPLDKVLDVQQRLLEAMPGPKSVAAAAELAAEAVISGQSAEDVWAAFRIVSSMRPGDPQANAILALTALRASGHPATATLPFGNQSEATGVDPTRTARTPGQEADDTSSSDASSGVANVEVASARGSSQDGMAAAAEEMLRRLRRVRPASAESSPASLDLGSVTMHAGPQGVRIVSSPDTPTASVAPVSASGRDEVLRGSGPGGLIAAAERSDLEAQRRRRGQ